MPIFISDEELSLALVADAASITAEQKYASLSGEFNALQSQRQKLDASFKQAVSDLHSAKEEILKLEEEVQLRKDRMLKMEVAYVVALHIAEREQVLEKGGEKLSGDVTRHKDEYKMEKTPGIKFQNSFNGFWQVLRDLATGLPSVKSCERKGGRKSFCGMKAEKPNNGGKQGIPTSQPATRKRVATSELKGPLQKKSKGLDFSKGLHGADKHERSWSKLNVSEVVAGRLSERNASSKCLCWKVVLCSQIDGSDRSSLSGSAAGSWLYSKIIPAGDHNDEDLITSSTDLSIWKKWITDLSSDEPICCLSVIKDARCDNLEENVAGANAVMFLVYECIPLRLQKQRLHNLVMALPSGSSVPLLILSGSYKSHSDPSFIANELGLNEVDNSRISCFSVVFLLENQNTVSHDGFFSDILLREGLEWLASRSPKQPVLQSVKTRELVVTHLNPLMEVLYRRSAYTVTPTHCVSAFNEALKQSVEEVVAAVDANRLGWPCPEVALLEKSSDVYRAVNLYLPRVGWSSAAEVEPLVSALKQCKLPSFSDDMTWLFSGSGMDHDNIENHKSRLEDCLTRYLTQTSQMMGFSLAKQEAHVMVQKFAGPELHESTYYIVLKWALIFRRVFNWRLNLLDGEISRAYVLKQNDTAVVSNMGVDIIQDEGVVSNHSIIEPSLDEMLQVSCSLRCYPESEASQPVGVMGLNPDKVLTATRGIEVIEEDRSSLQNNSGGDIDNDGSSTLEDIENTEGSQCCQDEEVATAKLILILRKWRRHCSLKRELRKKKQIAADTALSLLSLGPSIRHYEEQQSTSGEFNVHLIMKERHDKHERSWSKLNVSEVVAGRLSERNASSKCLCWKVVLCSQIDGSDRSSLSGSAAGSWLYSKIMPAGDHNDEDLITSSTDLSIWKKWINDLSSDEPICCLSIIKDARCDNMEENVAGANAVMFLVYECIPLRLQKQRLHNLVMALPSGSSVPLLILSGSYKSHSDPSFIANDLGLNEVDNSRISCFSVVFLLENQNTVSHDGFFSDILLREGLEWLASRSPKQPVLQSVKTRELVFTHLNPLMEVLYRRSANTITPTHCVSAFNEALKQSVEEVVAAVDANPLGWPCPEVALLEKSSDVYRAVNLYLPRVGWSSAAEVEPLVSALKQCKLPSFSDDMTWLFSGSGMDHDNIENHKSRLEDFLTRYLTQTSQMMGFSLAKQEAHVMVQKFARPELHESTYYIVLKWAVIFRRVFNWRLNRLNGEISRAYVLKQNDTAVVTNMGVDIIQDEGVISYHSLIEPSLDEMLQVSCSLRCYPESEASQPVGVMGLNPNKVLTATRGIEVIEEDRSSLQNNSGGDIDNVGSSTLEDIENTEGSQCYQDEEVATAKLILILRKWRRHCSLKRELRKKKQIAADTALSLLSLGPSIRHYEEQQSTSGEFNIHLIMKERHDKLERSWSKLNVSEVVAGRLSERNASSKCLCWKVVLCSQIDGSDRSSLSGSAAGSWLYSKIMPAGDHNDEDLITSSTDLSIWKKWINDLSSDEPICCLSIIKDARCDNMEENVAGANAVMFLVYECIPLRLQKQRLHNLVMALPSGSSVPLLILSGSYKSHSDPSFIANDLGLNEVDNSRISCFSVVFLLENQNTVSHDGFFSDILLREGLEWLASRSPKQPVLQSVKTRELVFTHLNPLMEVLYRRSANTITPTHCVSAFNEALKQSVEEVVAAVDANPLGWPCPEVALLEKSSDVYRAVNLYLPRVGWSSAAEVEPLVSALKQCKLPSFSDDMTWLFSGSGMDHDNIENHKSRLEDCLTRYLTQTSQMMGFSLAKQEARVMVQKFARPELHESTYYIVLKWAVLFRRVFNWRLNRLNGEISRAYVLKQNDTAVVTNMGVDIIQDEGVVSYHSIIEPSLDEMLQVSCSFRCYPESEASQPVGVMGLNPNKVLTATRGIEVIEEDRSSLQNNSGGDIDNDGNMNPANSTSIERAVDHVTDEADRLSKLLEKCNAVQNMIDKKLSIYF